MIPSITPVIAGMLFAGTILAIGFFVYLVTCFLADFFGR